MGQPLPRAFYARKATLVAQELLGKIIVHRLGQTALAGRIVETEAYLGKEDPSSHAHRGPTPRSKIMFEEPGKAYVYFVYGNHYCFNVVAHDGEAGAVLIRGMEPLLGIPSMMKKRKTSVIHNLTNGPGKLTQALGISKEHNGVDLTSGNFMILSAPRPKEKVLASPRIGIRKARRKLFRFSLKGNPFVSFPHP